MSKDYINSNYILNVYEKNSEQQESLISSASVTQSVTTEEQQYYVRDYVEFVDATGSLQESGGAYSYPHMIFASRSATTSLSNRLFTHTKLGDTTSTDGTFGRSVVISGSTMVVNSRQRNDVGAFNTRSMRDRQGVFIFKSSSSGWAFSDAVFPTSSLYPIHASSGPQPEHVAKNFDVHNNFVAIAAPLSAGLGVVLIYKSSSAGWAYDASLGSGSFSPAYWTQSDATSNNALTYYIANGQEGIMPSVKVFNDKLVVGGFSAATRPDTSTSYSTSHRSSSLAVFSSSSVDGWAFEQVLGSNPNHTASAAASDYYRKGMGSQPGHFNGAIDFDGTTIIAAGQGGYEAVQWQSLNGRISLFKSSSAGWYEEDQIDLRIAGYSGSVSASLTPSSPDITSGTGTFAGSQEWKLYTKFGYYSCAISGNYFAATAKGYEASSNSPRIKNRIFIFKSGSTGWNHEADFKSPNPGTGGDGTHNSASYKDEFGYTLIFNRSAPGQLVTRSPSYRPDPAVSGDVLGRVHVYKSSSVSGWALERNIENPYSGSVISHQPSGSSNYRNDYWKYGDHAGYGTEGSGDYLSAVATGLDGSHLAVPFSDITESENDSGTNSAQARFGAIQILSGNLKFRQETQDINVTESVTVYSYITSSTSNAPMPFIKAVRGPMNMRLQSGSKTPFSSEFGSKKNPG